MMQIDVLVTVQSPLHIGALSPAGTASVRGLVKDRYGWPFVPASSFKGRLRHSVECLARALGYETVCDTGRTMCRSIGSACPVCQIFGSPWIPGRVCFVNLTLSAPSELARLRQAHRAPPVSSRSQRYGVALNRPRKVASDHLLYTTELFEPGVPLEFSGTLTAQIEAREAAWIVAGVNFLESLGGSRTRGLGWIRGQATVKAEDGKVFSMEELRAYLEMPHG